LKLHDPTVKMAYYLVLLCTFVVIQWEAWERGNQWSTNGLIRSRIRRV